MDRRPKQTFLQSYVFFQILTLRCGEGNGTPLQYSCLENPMDGGTWWAAVCGVAKSRPRLSNFTFSFHFHALEKEMATHSCVLAWRIPRTGECSGLPSMGSHRVWHGWSALAAAAAAAHGMSSVLCQSQSPSSYPSFPPWYPYIISQCLCLYFCFPNKIIYTILLDSTYIH